MPRVERGAQGNRALRPSIRVPQTEGEHAIRLLAKAGVLDRKFSFKRDGSVLHLPLLRRLKAAELDLVGRELGGSTFEEEEFDARRISPRNLEEALFGQIPKHLISGLPRSYDIVGGIAILELNHSLVPCEKRIAEAILRVQPQVRSVFAKAGPVAGAERVRPLRYVAGDNRTETVHREFGCSFKVDLARAFFSPRLSAEHDRVAGQVGEGETVVDMFAGVGVFSILIARRVKNVTVDAIDSNPEATELMEENVRMNRVASKVRVHYGDARRIVEESLLRKATRVIMNNPSGSKEFVDGACEALQPAGGIVHYYTFAHGKDPESGAEEELEQALNPSKLMIDSLIGIRRVREIAPMKWQIVIDARLVPTSL